MQKINVNYSEASAHHDSIQKRITLTDQIINSAKTIIFVTGQNQARIISKINNSNESNRYYSASLLNPNEEKVLWILESNHLNLQKE